MIVIYTPQVTNRIQYILEFVFGTYFGLPYRLVTTPEPVNPDAVFINYSNTPVPGYFSVYRDVLLLTDNIVPQKIFISRENEISVFFQTTENYDLRFDIFSAVFYLLSRYEEYLPHEQDQHGRFLASNSILANDAFQFCPVVEFWLQDLQFRLLNLRSDLPFKVYVKQFEPTFDIDQAFAHKGRRWPKILGPLLKPKTWKYVFSSKQDPYDTVNPILEFLDKRQLRGRFFFLLNDIGPFNSSVNPWSALLRQQIQTISSKHDVGLHPSFGALEEGTLPAEKQLLEEITGVPVTHSRQHFLRIRFPDYYEQLIQIGIEHDHSLGYPEQPGFRAGFSRSYPFFNLRTNQPTTLTLQPFCVMDATFIYYKSLDTTQIIKKILGINKQVSKVNGKLVTISHNDLLGIQSQVNFWKVLENCAV